VDPDYEARTRIGRRIIAASAVIGCLGWVLMVVAFLAVWQFLAPAERIVPSRPRVTDPH
jgi:hypothetical protein